MYNGLSISVVDESPLAAGKKGSKMASFGQTLRLYRKRCSDPLRGAALTQERLGELLGEILGDAGYSGAAVSEWERDKSKIDEDNRPVLVGLVSILKRHGGLTSPDEANALLHAGNYRALNSSELAQLFPGSPQKSDAAWPAQQADFGSRDPASKPVSESISKARRKQLILLDKVKAFWVEGVLEKAALKDGGLSPQFHQVRQSIVHPWDGVVGPAILDQEIPRGKSPLELFRAGGQSLLILGEPGAGKTMMLIALARALINRAEVDDSEPIPVILNLMSWAEQRPRLEDWAVEELAAKYMIPRQTGRQWLADDDLILLLDGFDDVPARQRPRCAEAINHFRISQGLSGIVVCSRSEEYAATRIKLNLGAAIELQPLSEAQIIAYIEELGPRSAQLKAAVDRDTTLREMARNPLMLSIMSQSYDDLKPDSAGDPTEATSASDFLATRRQRLFDTYVRSMFRRRAPGKRFSQEQTLSWLAWLASQMYHFQQSPLLIEQIQPSWLPRRPWRWSYMMLGGLISGIVSAFIIWLLLQILRLSTPQLAADTAGQVASTLGISQNQATIVTLLAVNILLGILFALVQGRYFESVNLLPAEPRLDSWTYRRHLALVGLTTGALTLAIASLYDELLLALAWATAEVFVFVIIARYIYGLSYDSEIRTVEALGWSWQSAIRGLVVGLLAAAAFELMGFLLYDGREVTFSIVIPAAGGAVLGGMRGRRLEAKSRPNQGIHLSLRNSFIAATLSAIILTALSWYLNWRTYALYTGALTFVIAGALFGGGNVLKHFLVRLLLWLHNDLPWDTIHFLDYAADLVFLRKVGGGYIFIHRLLQQYFASLHQPHLESGADLAGQAADLRRIVSRGSGG